MLALAGEQEGALSRRQLVRLGIDDAQIARELAARRWSPSALPGVYLRGAGSAVGYPTRCWAGLLYAGEGAVLSHATAAWWWSMRDNAPDEVHVTVPVQRRVRPQKGLRIHYAVHLADTRHPTLDPPRTRVEDTVLDLADLPGSKPAEVIDLVLRACQRRLTTADRLTAHLDRRLKIRHRALLTDLLADVVAGVLSALERRYFRGVERGHQLPRGTRNRAEGRAGRRRYRDVRYDEYALVVELDGAAYHPAELREHDQMRDNELLVTEEVRTLRFGWRAVTATPCAVAGQVAAVLARGGWDGTPQRCGPGCTLPDPP